LTRSTINSGTAPTGVAIRGTPHIIASSIASEKPSSLPKRPKASIAP